MLAGRGELSQRNHNLCRFRSWQYDLVKYEDAIIEYWSWFLQLRGKQAVTEI
jgi:hypothetical protein